MENIVYVIQTHSWAGIGTKSLTVLNLLSYPPLNLQTKAFLLNPQATHENAVT